MSNHFIRSIIGVLKVYDADENRVRWKHILLLIEQNKNEFHGVQCELFPVWMCEQIQVVSSFWYQKTEDMLLQAILFRESVISKSKNQMKFKKIIYYDIIISSGEILKAVSQN